MRSVLAMMRASLLTAASYRLAMVLSIGGLIVTFAPVYYITGALQPLTANAIRGEADTLFGFVIVGMAATFLFTTAASALPRALSSAISSGTLEAFLVTRTSLPQVIIGLVGYGMLWTVLRAALLVGGAALVGVPFAWAAAPGAALIATAMTLAYFSFGLIAASLVLVFRTAGPFVPAILLGSGLLGGVYYPTHVIPSWLQEFSALVPATYALRPIRKLLFTDASWSAAMTDVVLLGGYTAILLAVSMLAFTGALRYARVAGTLSQY